MGWGPAGGMVAGIWGQVAGDGGKVAGNREDKGEKVYMRRGMGGDQCGLDGEGDESQFVAEA
ncbi:hypothetical protein TIFTF001_025257 [Ficus carica]|uniref:Uncharacterized protein n=1 Tax=Ficus carica TaxID=3494 RepID=A0AA88APM7_FICCA|nr:hypothetical protein TIFTF001_025257 [Ficus carica]